MEDLIVLFIMFPMIKANKQKTCLVAVVKLHQLNTLKKMWQIWTLDWSIVSEN